MESEKFKLDNIRKFAGIALSIIAFAFSVFILEALYTLWVSPDKVGMVKLFTEMPDEFLIMKMPQGDYTLPPLTLITIGVLFCICILSGFLFLTRLIIISAIGLLFPDGFPSVRALKKDVGHIKKRLFGNDPHKWDHWLSDT